MNFLELAKRVRQEVGYSGTGPEAVIGQSGVYQRVVDWVQDALREIHHAREQWRFDWARFTADLAAGQASYSLFQQWGLQVRSLAPDPVFVFRLSDGALQRHWLCMMTWEDFRRLPSSSATGIPIYAALSPDDSLHLHPAPMDGLTVSLDYYRDVTPLDSAQDVPRIPEPHHMAIVWQAVSMAAAHDENQVLMQMADKRLRDAMARLERTELPDMGMPDTFA